jgi:precorrin-3B C17-methyltransferase
VVGLGPGGKLDRTHRAEKAIAESQVVSGYTKYLEQITDLTASKELISSGMTQEIERCKRALDRAIAGATVSLVSSGDAGIYGMAGLALELAEQSGASIDIEIVPGVSAANAAAARLGAPLMLDFACISLSDLLVPWPEIRQRLEAVAKADLVVALYNPRSKKRVNQLEEAAEILRASRPGSTPVGIATAVGHEDEKIVMSTLRQFLACEIGMRSIVIVGNRSSKMLSRWFVTPRGYEV